MVKHRRCSRDDENGMKTSAHLMKNKNFSRKISFLDENLDGKLY